MLYFILDAGNNHYDPSKVRKKYGLTQLPRFVDKNIMLAMSLDSGWSSKSEGAQEE